MENLIIFAFFLTEKREKSMCKLIILEISYKIFLSKTVENERNIFLFFRFSYGIKHNRKK